MDTMTLGSCELVSPCHDATVHIPDCARYPRSLVGQQETNHFGDIMRLADSSDRVERVESLQSGMDFVLIDEALVDRCLDNGGRDRVYADSSSSQFHCKMLRKRVKARLGHGVRGGRSRGDCLSRPHRSNVYDTPSYLALDHIPRHGLCNKEQRFVDAQVSVVVLDGVIKEGFRNEDPGSIHEVARIRVLEVDSRAQRIDFGHPHQIGLFAAHGPEFSEFLDRCRNVVVPTSDHDCRTAALQEQSDNHPADSTRAPNHNQLPTNKLSHWSAPLELTARRNTLRQMWRTHKQAQFGWMGTKRCRSMKSEEKKISPSGGASVRWPDGGDDHRLQVVPDSDGPRGTRSRTTR